MHEAPTIADHRQGREPLVIDRGQQHATGTAGGVVDRLTFLGVEDLDHHPHHAARGVELASLVATGDVGELAHEVLVGVAQDIGVDGVVAELDRREAFDHVLDQLVGELLLVAPVTGAEDAGQSVGVDPLDLLHGVLEGGSDVLGGGANVAPVATVGNVELVEVGGDLVVNVFAECFDRLFMFFVPGVAEPSQEQQREQH